MRGERFSYFSFGPNMSYLMNLSGKKVKKGKHNMFFFFLKDVKSVFVYVFPQLLKYDFVSFSYMFDGYREEL